MTRPTPVGAATATADIRIPSRTPSMLFCRAMKRWWRMCVLPSQYVWLQLVDTNRADQSHLSRSPNDLISPRRPLFLLHISLPFCFPSSIIIISYPESLYHIHAETLEFNTLCSVFENSKSWLFITLLFVLPQPSLLSIVASWDCIFYHPIDRF